MAAIGRALTGLTDPSARQRVLKWATERFAIEKPLAPELFAAPVTPVAADPALAVDSLNDMFAAEPQDDEFEAFDPYAAPAPAPEAKLPLDVVVRSFAEDFQRFAEEWNAATA